MFNDVIDDLLWYADEIARRKDIFLIDNDQILADFNRDIGPNSNVNEFKAIVTGMRDNRIKINSQTIYNVYMDSVNESKSKKLQDLKMLKEVYEEDKEPEVYPQLQKVSSVSPDHEIELLMVKIYTPEEINRAIELFFGDE